MQDKMSKVVILLLGLLTLIPLFARSYDDGGWVNAHATFYGGGDASGTMGKFFFYHVFLLSSFLPFTMGTDAQYLNLL